MPAVFSDQDLEEKLISSPNNLFENVFMQDRFINNSSCDGEYLTVPNYSSIHPAEISEGGRVSSGVMALLPQRKHQIHSTLNNDDRYHPHRKAKLKVIEQNKATQEKLNMLIMSATHMVNRKAEDSQSIAQIDKQNDEF